MEWQKILALIFGTLLLDSVCGIFIYALFADEWYAFIPMPGDFRDNTEMNWFGCIVCYIFSFLFFPIPNICKFIYWLFHI